MRLFTRAGRRSIIVAVSILGLAAVTGVVSIAAAGTHQARAASADSSGHWVGTWGASAQPATPASLAGPGEVLVSATTHDLLDGSELSFDLHGEHELKGLRGKRSLFALRR